MNEALLTFILAVSCPPTKMINRSKLPWVQNDRETMKYCQKRCPYEYDDSPCLKRFLSWDFRIISRNVGNLRRLNEKCIKIKTYGLFNRIESN